jgi:phosphoglucomutase
MTTLIDVDRLRARYYEETPDPAVPGERVAFGTSGHRGSAERRSFNEAHILAVAQAVCEYRRGQGTDGPLFLGMDTHALSPPAQRTVIEVLAANGVEVRYAPGDAATPTPVISHAILGAGGRADGIVVSPSHNPPEDGGIKYNPPSGGPAETAATTWIEDRANELLAGRNAGVKRMPYERAVTASNVRTRDFVRPYVDDLASVIDMEAIAGAKVKIGADPMGGASVGYWGPIGERYALALTVVNPKVDPTFSFVPPDHDGKIRMDCSSPHAMAKLVALRDRYDIACGNDTDADRHGIVTRAAGLMNPNHYLVVAVHHLFSRRSGWAASAAIGKTLVTTSLMDRVAKALGRRLVEVPVGFKWFVDGLLSGELGFGGEESAGASFLRKDGKPWTTDKDGILLCLLAAEILAVTGRDPGDHYRELTGEHGAPVYVRLDVPATPAEKAKLKKLSPDLVTAAELAGEPIQARLTRAPGNDRELGGLKVVAKNGWFAARPSGTEDIYKIYAESFRDEAHLAELVKDAKGIVARALG